MGWNEDLQDQLFKLSKRSNVNDLKKSGIKMQRICVEDSSTQKSKEEKLQRREKLPKTTMILWKKSKWCNSTERTWCIWTQAEMMSPKRQKCLLKTPPLDTQRLLSNCQTIRSQNKTPRSMQKSGWKQIWMQRKKTWRTAKNRCARTHKTLNSQKTSPSCLIFRNDTLTKNSLLTLPDLKTLSRMLWPRSKTASLTKWSILRRPIFKRWRTSPKWSQKLTQTISFHICSCRNSMKSWSSTGTIYWLRKCSGRTKETSFITNLEAHLAAASFVLMSEGRTESRLMQIFLHRSEEVFWQRCSLANMKCPPMTEVTSF